MFAEKRAVIVVAAVLVVCVLLFCNAAPTIEAKPRATATTATPAKTPITLTISAPPSAQVRQSFSITGQLTSNGAPFTKSATVYLQRSNGNTWTTLASQSVMTGTYSFSRTETAAKTHQYRTTYTGGTTDASATSPSVTVNIKPTPIPTPIAKTTVKQATTTPTAATTVKQATTTPTAATTVKQATTTPTPTLDPTPIPTPTPSAVISTANATALGPVTVVQGQNFTIPLQLNPSTGYSWKPQFDRTALSLVDSVFISDPKPHNLVGVPGSQVFTFQGTKQGTSIITFNNISPSNQTANSLTATVTVTAVDPTPTATPTATPTPTPTPTSLQKSVFTITVTNWTPAVNQPYTVYGSLQDGLTGAPLANQPFMFSVKAPGGQDIVDQRATTGANGAYSFTRNESAPGSYWLQVSFYGNSNYSWSSQMLYINVGDPIPTTIQSLNVKNNNPAIGQPFTISGYLTDTNGTPLPDRTIWVNIRLPNSNGNWDMSPNTTTAANGYFSMTFSEQSAGLYRFECHFYGDSIYAQCGPAVEVTVGTIQPTKISMNTSIDHPAVNQPFTLSGYLTDANGAPLSGKEILLSRIVVGQPMPMGPFGDIYTDQNGYYSFVLSENASGSYQYMVNFYGDQTYASSYFWLPLTVGTLPPTALTVTSSTTTPAVNQPITLSGTLTANGAPLSGKPITLSIKDPSGNWSTVNTTTTNANGAYSFTYSESAPGAYLFNPVFNGDIYARASVWVSITVGAPA